MKRLIVFPLLILTASVLAASHARAAAGSLTIMPEKFLRQWDPVTVFYKEEVGKPPGTPQDVPGDFLKMTPAHPGACIWLDPKTLQFRPADPWPPMTRVHVETSGVEADLLTLMEPPVQAVMTSSESVILTFSRPVGTKALADAVRVELRDLPGVDEEGGVFLDRREYSIKERERATPQEDAVYIIGFNTPVAPGKRVTVHLRLSLEGDHPDSFTRMFFDTDRPFHVLSVAGLTMGTGGAVYGPDEAVDLGVGTNRLDIRFSARPAKMDAIAARNLVRITPPVEKGSYSLNGSTLTVSGSFIPDMLYRVELAPRGIADETGRRLDPAQKVGAYFYFPSPTPKVSWTPKWGVLESRGPQMLTMEARGFTQLDLRIHKVSPHDRNLWPFPKAGLTQDEKERPPGPGEEPAQHGAGNHIPPAALLEHVRSLGTPDFSDIVRLPLDQGRGTARFGLDIKEHLARIGGKNQPGHYLVGMRRLDSSSTREWTRIQVTDLAMTIVEERDRIRFVVTSLSTGLPVEQASVKLEGRMGNKWTTFLSGVPDSVGNNIWTTFFSGVTDSDGWCVVTPSDINGQSRRNDVLRVSVSKGDDVLVVEPSSEPELYADNRWEQAPGDWLDWIVGVDEGDRLETPELLGHVFTERPVYKPEEPVHIQAFVRSRHKGRLSFARLQSTQFVVNGPGRLEWRYPVKEMGNGTYYHKFLEENLPTGEYEAHLEGVAGQGIWSSPAVTFKKEAYRIPRFEVALHAADKAPIDAPFVVTMTATYYAGGRVAERPVDWRVTQFPYPWSPKGMEGFFFSSDARFSGAEGFRSTAAISKSDLLDAEGSAALTIDPTIEPTAQPRTYVVEGTVTGADDQTVTATKSIVVLPPFLLGLKSPRFLENARVVEPEAVVLGIDEKPRAGVEVIARLINRQWHSHLASSDFTDGRAKYVTDVVDEKIEEQTFVSTVDVRKLSFAIPQAGVYVLELEARDKMGRAQTVSVDFYAGGKEEVAWPKPTEPVFEVTTDKSRYDPGETATYLLNSPFGKARALVILETPDGNRYEWIDVAGGNATWKLTMEPQWVPRIPVHFVLMRGRDASIEQKKGAGIDFAKPATMAATKFTTVNARSNRVEVHLEYPEKTMPGREIEVTIRLKDPDGNPLSGRVALWLVDRAVMALGKEQELDPLNDFIREVDSFLSIVDTRFMVEGFIPFSENPGGEAAAAAAMDAAEKLMNKATVRKRFETVPYYEPALEVDSTGVRTVKIAMPDNLTDFLLRAKGVSGADRFGSAKGMVSVRLPLIVQPALPRFVRPGDSFTAAAIGRVVEGEGGPGLAAYSAEGVKVDALPSRPVEWTFNKPERIEFPVRVDQPPTGKGGEPAYDTISFKVAVSRDSDGASDAFEVKLPVKADRRVKVERLVADLTSERGIDLPAVKGGAREGSVHRQVLVAAQPALLKMAAGLNFLMEYPFGCTEQRLAQTRVQLALVKFRKVLHIEGDEEMLRKTVADMMEWLSGAVNEEGLISFWPGSHGYVALTAWAYEFLVEAGKAGFQVDNDLKEKMGSALRSALRSDYSRFIDAASWYERTAALQALAIDGALERSYAGEMARKSQYLDIESAAQVLFALKAGNDLTAATSVGLLDRINRGTIVQLYQGKEVYGGLQEESWYRNDLVLPSETRALAQVTRALKATGSADARLPVLVKGLVDLGKGDGWGSTNANAAALLALSDIFAPPFAGIGSSTAIVRSGDTAKELLIDSSNPMALSEDFQGTAATLTRASGSDPLGVRATLKWIPAEDGSREGAESNGFAVTREMLLVHSGDAPATRLPIEKPGKEFGFSIADVVEEHLEVVNPRDRFFVAVVAPLAAGMEPLNPNLATAPPEAVPAGKLTLAPSYAAYLDDQVAFYYDSLPKGTYHFYFRTRASTEGRFIQPAAFAELMYEGAVRGNSNGSLIVVKRGE